VEFVTLFNTKEIVLVIRVSVIVWKGVVEVYCEYIRLQLIIEVADIVKNIGLSECDLSVLKVK